MMAGKVVTAMQAAAVIKDGDTITTSGFAGIGVPNALLAAVKARFLETSHPRDLSLVFAAGQGDGKDRGLNRLGHDGLLKRVIGGHWGLVPKVAQLAIAGKIEGWNLPQGVISQLYRDISTAAQVTLMEIGGEDILCYPAQKLKTMCKHIASRSVRRLQTAFAPLQVKFLRCDWMRARSSHGVVRSSCLSTVW